MSSVGNSVAFQVVIASTGTPQHLPSYLVQNGGNFHASSGNTASIVLSPSPTVTSTTGYVLEKGLSVDFSGSNTNQLWAVGTTADILSFLGN